MLFNSAGFFFFLAVVVPLYWCLVPRSGRWQNVLLVLAGICFYISIDQRFLFVLLLSAFANYTFAIRLVQAKTTFAKRWLFWCAVAVNLGALGYFKYLDFFYSGFFELLNLFGANAVHDPLKILLPLSISFYTLQMLGYIIDVESEEIEPSRDPIAFLAYALYFPKMLAGPIERAQNFLPQVAGARLFDDRMAADGCKQILWGLFAKVVIADHCGTYVDDVFDHHGHAGGSTLLLGAVLYLFQIYCDFSGYSNIALGVSKLFGIQLMVNFAYPLFTTNISDFWRRWHISLTTWMMDYVYTPLSFLLRRLGQSGLIIAILVTFLAVGFWHGAKLTSIVFGLLQGLLFIPLVLTGGINVQNALSRTALMPSPRQAIQMMGIFVFMVFAFIVARAETMTQAFQYMVGIFRPSLFSPLPSAPLALIIVITIFMIAEWFQRDKEYALRWNGLRIAKPLRYAVYYLLVLLVLFSGNSDQVFIYFQF